MGANDSAMISAVAAAGELFRQYGGERVARDVIGRGGDLLDFYKALPAVIGTDPNSLDRASGLNLTEGEIREYSVSRLVNTMMAQRAAYARQTPDSFDRNLDAVRQEIANERRATSFESSVAGNRVPWSVLMRDFNAAQAPNGTTLGTAYTPDALRGYLPLAALGAQIIPVAPRTGGFKVPTLTGDLSTVTFLGETEAANEGEPATGMLDLSARRIGGYVDVSRQALVQGGRAMDRILARVIFGKVRSVLEANAISGDGSGNTPLGVRNVPGVGSVVGGSNGAALNWSHLADMVHGPAVSNVGESASGFLINPGTRKYLSKTQRAAGLNFMWDGGALPLHGHRAAVSTLIPGNLVKGSSGAVCSSVVFSADWSNLLVVLYGAPELTVDPYSRSLTGQVRITIDAYVGIGVLHASAFAKMDDALTP